MISVPRYSVNRQPTLIRKYTIQNHSMGEWMSIVHLVKSCTDIRSNFCIGCGKGALWNKDNEVVYLSRKNTLAEVTALIDKIRNNG